MFRDAEPTTDVARYPEMLRKFAPLSITPHFPQTIPADATLVRFFARPGFLQGSTQIQLRLRLPRDRYRAVEAQLQAAAATATITGPGDGKPWSLPFFTADASTPGIPTDDFPAHYTVHVLGARDRAGGSWNHGESHGVALWPEGNEVVYWGEDW